MILAQDLINLDFHTTKVENLVLRNKVTMQD